MPRPIDQLPLPRALLFDLDGTLVDTVQVRISAWVRAFAAVGLPTSRETLAPLIGLDGRRLAREVAALAGRPIDEEPSEEIDRHSGEIYEQLNQATPPRSFSGVGRLVAALDAHGITWAIATSSRREQVQTLVEAIGLPREPTIFDASHVKHAKPEPDLLLHAAAELGIDPGDCWYVGDSTWDMVSAVAAGMIAIGVTAGSAVDGAILAAAGAAAVVGTLDDVAAAIERR